MGVGAESGLTATSGESSATGWRRVRVAAVRYLSGAAVWGALHNVQRNLRYNMRHNTMHIMQYNVQSNAR